MKKFLSLFFGCLIVLFVFAAQGQPTKAAEKISPEEMQRVNGVLTAGVIPSTEPPADCECHNVTPVLGAEKNKIAAELISSDEFNFVKQDAKKFGYRWSGANAIQVVTYNSSGMTVVGVPFESETGTQVMFVFANGLLLGITTM